MNEFDEMFTDPSWKDYERRVRDEVAPRIRSSAVGASIVPEDLAELDVKFAVELGLMIMFDKPLCLIIKPGQTIPEHLVRVADEIVEMGSGAPEALKNFVEKYR